MVELERQLRRRRPARSEMGRGVRRRSGRLPETRRLIRRALNYWPMEAGTIKISGANEPGAPAVVDRATFQAKLDALRVREKAHTREGDAIAAARRRLPMVEVDGATPLVGEHG